ncbi:MAG: class I SAM-dependent methyltransferase [Dehalococcoidia bacterium]
MPDVVEKYLEHLTSVRGWLHPDSAHIISDLSDIQRECGVSGAVGEVGVKWGRLFILLHLKAAPGERSLAIDTFDDRVAREFHRNTERWTGGTDFTLFRRSSLDVHPRDVLNAVGRCRLLSIDGGHEEETVLNDLELADAVIEDGGVVIVDDFFNPKWPGVAGATARYLLQHEAGGLRPFATSPGKVYLAGPEHRDAYRSQLELRHPRTYQHTQPMFGTDVAVFGGRAPRGSMGAGLRMMVRASPLGPQARRARRLLRNARR